MNEDRVRWAVVGVGGMGKGRAKLIQETDGAQLIAVADVNEETASIRARELGCRSYTELDDLLKDDELEVVFFLTPSGMHVDGCIAAMEAGKHAVTTKPMDVSEEKCRHAIEVAQKSGKILAVDFQFRYMDRFLALRQAVKQNLFGKLVLGESRLKKHRDQDYYDHGGGWRGTWKYDGGGSLANQSVHEIDLLLWTMGRPTRVWARHGIFTHEMETEDLGMAMIEFENGAVGTILATTTFPQKGYSGLEVHGKTGGAIAYTLVPKGQDGSAGIEWFLENEENIAELKREHPFNNVVEDIVSAVRNGTQPVCDGTEGLRSVAFLKDIYRSAADGGGTVDCTRI